MSIESLTAILVFVTAIYAYLTYRMSKTSEASVEEMRKQSEATMRPYIVVAPFVRPHTQFFYLRIVNTGKNTANNLKLSIDKDFFELGVNQSDKNLRNKSAFTVPIDSFPPNTELIFLLAQGWILFEGTGKPDVCPTQFTITAQYEFSGKQFVENHHIDLRGYLGSQGERDAIVDELEKIRIVMEKNKNA